MSNGIGDKCKDNKRDSYLLIRGNVIRALEQKRMVDQKQLVNDVAA